MQYEITKRGIKEGGWKIRVGGARRGGGGRGAGRVRMEETEELE